jgi:hypothetical protein
VLEVRIIRMIGYVVGTIEQGISWLSFEIDQRYFEAQKRAEARRG